MHCIFDFFENIVSNETSDGYWSILKTIIFLRMFGFYIQKRLVVSQYWRGVVDFIRLSFECSYLENRSLPLGVNMYSPQHGLCIAHVAVSHGRSFTLSALRVSSPSKSI